MNSREGPLAGFRIIEFSGIGPTPFACMVMAGLGAEVIRIDRPNSDLKVGNIGLSHSSDVMGRDRRSIVLDLKSPQGVDLAKRLVASADGVIEGFRPMVMERLGLGPNVLLEVNPGVTVVRMTGWGQNGSLAKTAGHDLNYIAVTGLLNAIGTKDGPVIPLNVVGDFAGGACFAVIGMLSGILCSRIQGRGSVVDAAIVDGVSLFSSMFRGMLVEGVWIDERASNLLDGGAPFYSLYQCKDGRYVSVAALEPQFYADFVSRLGLQDNPDFKEQYDQDSWPRMRELLKEIFQSNDSSHFRDLFYGTDSCFAVVEDLQSALSNRHLVERDGFVKLNGVVHPREAPRFDGYSHKLVPPPTKGQHTSEILAEIGLSAREIESLMEKGVCA